MVEYPTKRHCDYCNKWIECKTIHSFGGHRTTCKYNPNAKILIEKMKNANTHKRRIYSIKCKKCENVFELYLTENQFKNKKEPYREHCSYKCSNSRIWTPEQNEIRSTKTSKSNKLQYKNGTRKAPLHYMSKWLPYKDIKVQGTYELRACKILDKWKKLGKIKDWEYTNDRFSYVGLDNKEHIYLVDFKVFNHNGTFYYIEVKGYETEIDKLKWETVKTLGYDIQIWFINEIRFYEK